MRLIIQDHEETSKNLKILLCFYCLLNMGVSLVPYYFKWLGMVGFCKDMETEVLRVLLFQVIQCGWGSCLAYL